MKKRAAPKRHYLKLVEWSEDDGVYVGRCPELFYGGVHGSDELKVYRELCRVVDDVLAMKAAHGDALPEPLNAREFSGKFVLRLDPGLHKELALRALMEGQSLNAYCTQRLGGGVLPRYRGPLPGSRPGGVSQRDVAPNAPPHPQPRNDR